MMELEKLRQQQDEALKEITAGLAKIAERSENADARFRGTDTVFKLAFGILVFLTLLAVALVPIYDRVTGHEQLVAVTVIVTPIPTSTLMPTLTTTPIPLETVGKNKEDKEAER